MDLTRSLTLSFQHHSPQVKRLGVFHFHHLEFDQFKLNFQMHEGLFNINGLTSFIAAGDLRAGSRFKDPTKQPNCLDVTVIRAKHLFPLDE